MIRANPKAAQWLHWLVVNVPGEELKEGEDRDGKVLMQHNGPAPPKGSGSLARVKHVTSFKNMENPDKIL